MRRWLSVGAGDGAELRGHADAVGVGDGVAEEVGLGLLGCVGCVVAEGGHGAVQLGFHGVEQDYCRGRFGDLRCCYCALADGGDCYDCQTGKTDASHCHFLSHHGKRNSFRVQITPVAECIGSAAGTCGGSAQKAEGWTGEGGLGCDRVS